MTFLQPSLLWGLGAAALPIVIHLLNRLRFRTVRWAAMLFLIKATRSSTRNARLRHWLVLACRTLAVLLFALALARPVVGGWLGRTAAGAPDTVILLFDRSVSMETVDPRRQVGKREYAIGRLAEGARAAAPSSRFVLIDSASRVAQEIAGPEALAGLAAAGPSDTAADFPALFRAALEYLLRVKPGRTEIWVTTDLQESNWMPDRRDWADLGARLAALPQDVRVRVLALTTPAGRNRRVTLRDAQLRSAGGRERIDLSMAFAQDQAESGALPVTLTLNGTRQTLEAALTGGRLDLLRRLDAPAGAAEGGWGRLDLPSDENIRDNRAFFVFGRSGALRAAVAGEDGAARRRLALAIAPPGAENRACETRVVGEGGLSDLRELGLLVWQGPAPGASAAPALRRFLEAGGQALFFPPASAPAGAVGAGAFFTWGARESAPDGRPFRVAVWDELDGPLARTADGRSLPVARLEVRTRMVLAAVAAETNAVDWIAAATCADGRPFLLRAAVGRGRAWICTTLPDAVWSNLGEGGVLVPLVQRLLEDGSRRLGRADRAVCGEWQPAEQEDWQPVDAEGPRDPRYEAGVYRLGERLLALNRPVAEDVADTVDPARVSGLLGAVPVRVTEDLSASGPAAVQSEIWPLFVLLALLFLTAEAALTLAEHVPQAAGRKEPA